MRRYLEVMSKIDELLDQRLELGDDTAKIDAQLEILSWVVNPDE